MQVQSLITSTPSFLERVAPRIKEGEIDVAGVAQELANSLIITHGLPGSTNELIVRYGGAYLYGLRDNTPQLLSEAYVAGITLAQQEGRYFDRSHDAIEQNFAGNRKDAASALIEFLTSHGIRVMSEFEYSQNHIDDRRRFSDYILESVTPDIFYPRPPSINGEYAGSPAIGVPRKEFGA